MSQPQSDTIAMRRDQIRQRLIRFRQNRTHGSVGAIEIVGLSISIILLLVTIISHLYFLVPANSRLAAQQRELVRLQTLLRTSKDVVRNGEDTRATVQRITGSMEDFEMRRLAEYSQGRM